MNDAEKREIVLIIARELDLSPYADPSPAALTKAEQIVETLYWRGVSMELTDWYYDD